MLQMTGERQISTTLEHIKPDHRQRYQFASHELTRQFEHATVLDAACGVGYGSYIMAKAGHSVTGIDIAQDAIDVARANYHIDELTRFQQCDIIHDPFPSDKMIDCIVSFETIEHVQEDELLLSKFTQIAPYLICSVPNEEILPYTRETFPFHFKHYTPGEFEQLLVNTGWEPVEWYTQYDKNPGQIFEADDGRTSVVIARNIRC